MVFLAPFFPGTLLPLTGVPDGLNPNNAGRYSCLRFLHAVLCQSVGFSAVNRGDCTSTNGNINCDMKLHHKPPNTNVWSRRGKKIQYTLVNGSFQVGKDVDKPSHRWRGERRGG